MHVSHSPKFTDEFERQLANRAAETGRSGDGSAAGDLANMLKHALTTVVRAAQRVRAFARSRKVGFSVA
jgi:hypothetical protein